MSRKIRILHIVTTKCQVVHSIQMVEHIRQWFPGASEIDALFTGERAPCAIPARWKAPAKEKVALR